MYQSAVFCVGSKKGYRCAMRFLPICLILCFLLRSTLTGNAQMLDFQLRILPLDADSTFLKQRIKFTADHSDSVSIATTLRQVIQQLHKQAYLEASVDTLTRVGNIFVALLHLGKQYQWLNLQTKGVESTFLNLSGYRERLYSNKPLAVYQLQQLQDELLKSAENNGYPFAQVGIDSIRILQEKVWANLYLKKGQFVAIEKLEIEGSLRLSEAYLAHYLGIKAGSPYNHAQILRLRQRLRELPFANLVKDPLVNFAEDRARLKLFLDKRRASRFDFLIGVLPNSRQVGRLLVTGSFTGEFYNQLGKGERVFAQFEALRPQTQELNLQFNYPYLLNLPFGIDTKFNLYKRDTTYLDVEIDFGLQYLLEGGNYLKVFWNKRNSNLLNIDSTLLDNPLQLPPDLDVSYGNFGIEYAFQRLDYRNNPRRGWNLQLRGAAGTRQIKKNNRVEALSAQRLYDSLDLRTFQYRLSFRAERFFPIRSRSTLKIGMQGAYILSENPIYRNEQYRIGGNQLLRGFDEELIFATNYTVGTLEYRLLIGQNSYLYVFGDYAYVEDLNTQQKQRDFPLGFGSGITFETRAGLFGVNLAFGTRQGVPLDFSAPKVHFGYVSLF